MSKENLITVYNPSLAALLLASETEKRAPLDEKEVNAIRDSATVLRVPEATALEMEQKRGHKDISSENAWAEWQELRKKV